MMADLQNSSFISWKENIMFLDNAWAELYQQIINHGDKTFLKEFNFTGNKISLPDDFHQLYYISYNNGISLTRPINRKAKTSIGEGPYYDIIGNELIIYNGNNSIRNVKVEYYPTRSAITFAADDISKTVDNIILEDSSKVLDTNDKYILVRGEENLIVYDLVNNQETASFAETGNTWVLNGNCKPINMTDKILFKVDGRVYKGTIEDGVLTLTKVISNDIDGKVFRVLDIPNNITLPEGQISTFTEFGIYWVDEEAKLNYFDFATEAQTIIAEDVLSSNIESWHNSVYYETEVGVFQDDLLIVPSEKYEEFVGVMKVDKETGYGILFTDPSEPTKFTIKSAFIDSLMEFPNNFYFNFLAYSMAGYYKIKQGADPNGMAILAEAALKTFYDTLPRDENEYVRISNVYAR